MTSYAALLRGVNVGGHNRVPMAQWREVLAGLGHTAPATLLASGNAVFDSDRTDQDELAAEIERAVTEAFGCTVRCLVRDHAAMRALHDANPMPAEAAAEPKKFVVAFLSESADPELLGALDPAAYAPEQFRVGTRELYVYCPDGLRDAKLSYALFERVLKLTATARNWSTVTKLLAMMDGR